MWRYWRRALLVLFLSCLVSSPPGVKAAMIVDTPYWATDSFTNELTAVNDTQPSPPCLYDAYPVFPTGSQVLCIVNTAWGEVSTNGLIRFSGETMFRHYDIGYRMSALAIGNSDRLYVKQRLENSDTFRVGYITGSDIANLKDGSAQEFATTYLQYNEELSSHDGNSYQFLSSGRTMHDLVFDVFGVSQDQRRIVGIAATITPNTVCWHYANSGTTCDRQTYTKTYVEYDLSEDKIAAFVDPEVSESDAIKIQTLSITNDGKAIVVSTDGALLFYSLGQINTTTSTDQTLAVNMRWPQTLSARAIGADSASSAYFTDDDKTVTYLAKHGNRIDQMKLWPRNAEYPSVIDNYLGMGDSFSSGEGELSYRPETNFYKSDAEYNVCHQSNLSYPYLINSVILPETFGSVACSGAKLQDISYEGSGSYQGEKPQATGVTFSKTGGTIQQSLLPGYIDQVQLLDYRKPSVATISIGGNDIGFADIVAQCVTRKFMPNLPLIQHTCYDTRDEREKLANEIDGKISKLTETFKTLMSKMSGERRLYVVGYPSVVADKAVCSDAISSLERNRANDIVDYLNAAVAQATNNAGAYYVDVTDAFVIGENDYRLCGSQSPTAMNSIVLTSPSAKKPGKPFIDNESYHPNAIGHILLTRTIRQQTNDLTAPMPPALDNEVDVVSDSVRQEFVGDAEKTVTTHTTHSDDVAPETIYKKPDNSLKNKLKAIFKYVAGSIRLEIHSDPVYLGTFTPAADGTVEGEYSLPPDLPIGYHELHFIYTDTSGQEQDVYQTVLVLDSPDDWDGDGILNTQEVSCAIGDNNDTTDINGDGYGDSCISYKEGSRQNDDTSNTEYLIQQAAANGIITPQEVALVYRALGKQPVTKVVSEQSRLTTSQTQTSTRSERSITHRKTSSNNLSTSQKAQNSAKRTLTLAVLAILICIGVVIAFVIRMCARRKPQ